MGTQNYRVLLIDGSATALVETLRPIADIGAQCELARSVEAAVVALKTRQVAMIFIDAASLSGDERTVLDSLLMLRQLARVPIVIIANEGTSAEVVESLWRAGADDLILRPVRAKQVADRLSAVHAAATVPKVERRNMKVCLFMTSDEPMRRSVGPLLEHEGFQLVSTMADELGLASLSAAAQFDCVVISAPRSSREVAALHSRLTSRRPELASLPTVLIGADAPATESSGASRLAWLGQKVFAPEMVVRALHEFMRRSTTALQAHTRVPFFCLVEFRDNVAPSSNWTPGFTFDLSPQGLFLKTLVPARPGTTIEFKLHLTTTGEEMLGTGVVAWANSYADRKAFTCPVGMGVQFLGMSPKPLAKLRDICRLSSPSAGGA